MRALVIAILASLIPASASAQQSTGPLQFVDLTAEFDRVAAEGALLDDKAKVALFEKRMTPLAEGFYARSRKPEGYDKRVLSHLKEYPSYRDRILKVSQQFNQLIAPARQSFEQAFGPMGKMPQTYLLHSLGEMDGGTRELNGKSVLIFGADGIVRYHGDNDFTPFFHHELFHVFHEPVMTECNQVWCSMWEEGLATFTASSLNPQAGEAALMLDQPAPIKPAVDANRVGAFCAARPLLRSAKDEDYASLFYGSKHLPNYPARMGYYLGYLVAKDMAANRSLQELAALKGPELERSFMAAYDRLATGCVVSGERG